MILTARNAIHALFTLLTATTLVLCTYCAAGAEEADVTLISGAPVAAETLADMLFPAPTPRYRSIVIDDAPAAPKAVGIVIQFDFDSSRIRPESHAHLDRVGEMLRLDRVRGRRLQIEGHTDSIGKKSYNQDLSERRATAIAEYLVRKHRVDPRQLEVVGHGEQKPLKGRKDDDPTNRRVQFQALEG